MKWRSVAAVAMSVGAGVLIGAWWQGTAVGQDGLPDNAYVGGFARVSFDFERMFGGVVVASGDVPWMLQLRAGRNYRCGATYIAPSFAIGGNVIDGWRSDRTLAPQYALTAAHCVADSTSVLTVVSGSLQLNGPADGEVQAVLKVILAEDGDRSGPYGHIGAALTNDIAILVLGPPINSPERLGAERRSIRLAVANEEFDDLAAVHTSGWGHLDGTGGRTSNSLLQVLLPLVPHDICASTYDTAFDLPGAICAGFSTGEYAACSGDSGGPLYYRPALWQSNPIKPEPVLIGVVSQRQGQCGPAGKYSVFSKVSERELWIRCELQPYVDLRASLWPAELTATDALPGAQPC